jgi:SNF2 family DNA or RNA helicase
MGIVSDHLASEDAHEDHKIEPMLYGDVPFKTKPYDHQWDAFVQCKDEDYFGLFADMGTGKSKMAIDIACYRYLKGDINCVLVIAPNNVHAQWIQEQFPRHCSVDYKPFLWWSGMRGRKLYEKELETFIVTDYTNSLKVISVNVEAFQSNTIIGTIAEIVKNHATFIIVDEATRIKTPTARRSKVIHKLNKYGRRCILTGTPTAKSPFDLWSQFEFLKENYFGCKFFIFQHRYGVMMKGTNQYTGGHYQTLIDEKTWAIVKSKLNMIAKQRNGKLMPDDYETVHIITGVSEKNVRFISATDAYTRYKRLDELKEYISKNVFSIRKEDCLDLPPKIYESIIVDMPKEMRRIYNTLKQELLVMYEGQELSVLNKVALTTRLMQICGGFFPTTMEDSHPNGTAFTRVKAEPIGTKNPKMEALLNDIEETDEQIIIWAHFVPELKAIDAELKKRGINTGLYYGGTGQIARERIIKEFKNGTIKAFIGNTATAGFGLNLQHCTLQYYFSTDFATENRLQAEDRSHRIGVKSACVYKDIILKNSIDERIYKNTQTGRDLNDFFKAPLHELLADEEVKY